MTSPDCLSTRGCSDTAGLLTGNASASARTDCGPTAGRRRAARKWRAAADRRAPRGAARLLIGKLSRTVSYNEPLGLSTESTRSGRRNQTARQGSSMLSSWPRRPCVQALDVAPLVNHQKQRSPSRSAELQAKQPRDAARCALRNGQCRHASTTLRPTSSIPIASRPPTGQPWRGSGHP